MDKVPWYPGPPTSFLEVSNGSPPWRRSLMIECSCPGAQGIRLLEDKARLRHYMLLSSIMVRTHVHMYVFMHTCACMCARERERDGRCACHKRPYTSKQGPYSGRVIELLNAYIRGPAWLDSWSLIKSRSFLFRIYALWLFVPTAIQLKEKYCFFGDRALNSSLSPCVWF